MRCLREMAEKKNPSLDIQVDGGVTAGNVRDLMEAGANVFVAGSAVFQGDAAANVKEFLDVFRQYEALS